MSNEFCLLTGGPCVHSITLTPNAFFIAEPYDPEREKREQVIKKVLSNYKIIIADNSHRNISLTCKICQQIQSSNYGIVDISNFNPNVVLELGILYGLKKPTIILYKRPEEKVDIPLNIIGIEQQRYSSYEELEEKLIQTIESMLSLPIITSINIKDIKIIMIKMINYLKLLNVQRTSPIKINIIRVMKINDEFILIIDGGINKYLFNELVIDVLELIPNEPEPIQRFVGNLIINNAQKNISQVYIANHDPSSQFWKDVLSGKNIPAHYLMPKLPSEVADFSVSDLTTTIQLYENVMRSLK